MKNLKNTFLLIIIAFLCTACPFKKPKAVDFFVEELEVLPKYRCPTDDILVKWKLNKPKDGSSTYCNNYGIVLYAQDKNDLSRKIQIFNSDENQGETLIILDETFGNDVPKEVIITGEPRKTPGTCLNNSQRLDGSKTAILKTIYDRQEVKKSGFNSEEQLNRFIVNFDPLLYSQNLHVESFKITKSCNNTISGIFEFDKGIATGNIDKTLKSENNYESEFVNSPVNLIGDWLVIANSNTGCITKAGETIEIAVSLICLNR